MTSARSARGFGRRYSVTVLAVTAVAVALLGLLVAQTSRRSIDGARMNVAGRQRMLSERLIAQTLLARGAPPEERALWGPRIGATVSELRAASQQLRAIGSQDAVIQPGSTAARDYETLVALQDSVKRGSELVSQREASPGDIDSLLVQQRRLAVVVEDVADKLEREWVNDVDRLVQLEAACVILLLLALAFGARIAVQPTQDHLRATILALEESESRTRAVLDAMPNGLLLVSAAGETLLWNRCAIDILDLPADATAAAFEDIARGLLDEHGAPLGMENLPSRRTIQSGKPMSGTVVATPMKDGRLKFLRTYTSPLYRAGSDVPHAAVTVFRDVTEDRHREEERATQAHALAMQNDELLSQAEALERGQALFRSLVETAGSVIVGITSDGHVFEWNPEAERLYGVKRGDAIGREYIESFVSPQHRERMRTEIEGVLRGESIRNVVGPVKDGNGERHLVLWNIAPLRAARGEPVDGYIAVGLDITEREASDERFRLLFERSSDAHMIYDAEGIIDCNQVTLDMLGVAKRETLVGKRPAELSPLRQPDGRLSVVVGGQMRERARITGNHRFEWIHRREDGTEFPVEVTLTPLRLHGRNVMLAVWHDIAERKSVEDALRLAKDAAVSANQMKSEFMTRMNHELRTPLTAIIGFSRVLLSKAQPGGQLYLERIRDNGMHLLSVINQILDVAKVEAGRMEMEHDVVSVDAIVDETLAMLESNADARRVTLRRELPDHIEPIVTDAGKLRQILINLVGNAIKFTEDGEVVVCVTADAKSGVPREIIVRDTGVGIPGHRLQKIFEPFEQGDSSTRREFGGTGLGLSIVQTFAELIGARVEVTSQVGVGTMFTVHLPEAIAP